MDTIRIYVGTYHKYNSGSLAGEWIDLDQFSDISEFYDYCAELHKDESDPEYMFQDFEAPEIITNMGLIGESHLDEKIFEIIEALENASYDIEVYEAFTEVYGDNYEVSELIERCEEAYSGEFEKDEDFAYDMAEQTGALTEGMNWPYTCIDWEHAAEELMYDYSEANGHYFRNF